MKTRTAGLSHFVAAAGATVITAVSAWAFVNSTASIERDPFQFASIMAANAKVRIAQLHAASAKLRIAQLHAGTASTCPNNPEIRDPLAQVCERG